LAAPLTTAQAIGSAATTFSATDSGATITKIAKFPWSIPENASNFAAAQSFVNGAGTQLSNGDYFVIQVTAADGIVNYTRVNVTVNSNIATLSGAVVKGQVATVGTASQCDREFKCCDVEWSVGQGPGCDGWNCK
jgi:hypothetical protein